MELEVWQILGLNLTYQIANNLSQLGIVSKFRFIKYFIGSLLHLQFDWLNSIFS